MVPIPPLYAIETNDAFPAEPVAVARLRDIAAAFGAPRVEAAWRIGKRNVNSELCRIALGEHALMLRAAPIEQRDALARQCAVLAGLGSTSTIRPLEAERGGFVALADG